MRHTQPRHISFTRLSHSLAKILALFSLLITVGIGNAWGWGTNVYLNGNFTGNNWNNATYQFTWWYNSTDGKYYKPVYATGSAQYFRLWTNNHVGPDSNNSEIDETSGGEQASKYEENNWKYIGDAGIINICIDQTGGKDWNPWVWIERPTIKFKYGWNGAVSWTEVSATDNRDGTYQYKGQYGGTAGFNAGPSSDLKYKESATTVTGSPSTGDYCLFKWNASGYKHNTGEGNDYGTFTITKLCTITYDANGATDGDVPADQEDILYNTATTVRGNTGSLVKTGYTFGGWNTEPDGTGTTYAAGSGSISPTDVTTTLYAMWGREFSLVTNVNQLEEETEIVILNTSGTKGLSTQAKSNRRAKDVVVVNNKVTIPDADTIQIITIEEAPNSKYRFKVGTDKYLYASSSSSNELKTTSQASAGDNGIWSIAIDGSSNVATVTAQGTNSRKVLQNNSNLFACYSSASQTAIKLYRCTSPYLRVTSDELSSFSYAVGYGPSFAQTVSVKAYNLTGNLTVACPSGYELSSTSATSGFSTSNLTLTRDANNKVAATFYIRLKSGNSTGSYNTTLNITGGGIAPKGISLTGSVIAVPSGTAYKLVTNAVNLFPDDEIVIMNAAGTYMMSTTQNTNNRGSISSGFTHTSTAVFVTSEDAQNIILEKCEDEWLFKVGDNSYLYAASGSNSWLRTTSKTYADNGNGNWKAEIDEQTGIALVFAPNSDNRRDTMQFNTNLFSCYSGLQTNGSLKLYAKPSATANVCGSPLSLSGFETTYGGSASAAQSFTVKARNITSGNVTVSAPTGYEVCLTEDGTYATSVTLTPVSNKVEPTTVYVRLKDDNNAGSVNGNISISATSATTRTIALTGTVAKAAPTLLVDESIALTLRGSSVVKEDLFLSESDGTCTLTFDTSGGGDDEEGVTFDQEANTLTFEKVGTWDITMSQAATDNYLAAEVEFIVEVTCGTPYTPENLLADDILSRSATLSWDAVDGADNYEIVIMGKSGGHDEEFSEVYDVTELSKSVTGLKPGCTYEWTLTAANSCGKDVTSDTEEFTTLYAVTYHAASEAKDSIIYDIESGDDLEDTYIPSNCATDRVFIGWSELEFDLSDDFQTADDIAEYIATADGTLDGVTGNMDLYAIYASRNGSDGHDYVDNFNGYTTSTTYNNAAPKIYGIWSVTNGTASALKDVTDQMGSNAILLQKNTGAGTMVTSKKIHNFTGLTCKIATTHSSVYFVIEYSTNGSSWTILEGPTTHASVRSAQSYTLSKAGDPVDAYVRFRITAADGSGATYRMYIDDVTLYSKPHEWIYTDYTTACTKPATVTVTFDKDGGTGDVPAAPATGGSITLPNLTKAGYMFDGFTAQADGQDVADGIYYAGERFLVNHSVTLEAQWTKYFEDIEGVSPITTGKDIAIRSIEVDSIVVNSDDCGTPTADINGDDKALFEVTIDAAHKRVAGGKTHFPYYVTYTPTEHNVTNIVNISFTCDGVESSTITVRGRSLPEEFVIVAKYTDDGKWYALPNDLATSSGTVPTPIKIYVDDNDTPTKALLAPATTVYKAADRYKPNPNTQFVSIRLTPDGSSYLRAGDANNSMWLATVSSVNTNWCLASSDLASYTVTQDPANNINRRIGFYNYQGIKMGFHSNPTKGSDIYFLPIENKASEYEATVTTWAQSHVEVTLTEALEDDADGVTATLGATSDDATAVTGSGTQYGLTFDDLDLANKSGQQLLLIWKNSSTTIGGSLVTIPSIVAPSADQDNWSEITATASDIVVLNQTTTVDVTDAVAKVVVLTGESQLIINANKALVVTGKITHEDGSPTKPSDIIIKSSADGNGTLIFENDGDSATVQMYSKATTEGKDWTWQYIGMPFTSTSPVESYYGGYLYEWPSDCSRWEVVTRSTTLFAFTGYSVSYPSAGHTFEMQGELAATTSKDIDVPAGKEMVVGNSWTAPIQLKQLRDEDFVNLEKNVYFYNVGNDSTGKAGEASSRYEAGTYVTVPIHSSPYTGDSVISALQGFYVTSSEEVGGENGSLHLSYADHVRPVGSNSVINGQMHAPKRAERQPVVLKIWADGSEYTDRVVLLEREDFSTELDKGWDGDKWINPECDQSPVIYTVREDGTKDAVSALPELDGTIITFCAGEDESYTLRFEYSGDDELYLLDRQEYKYTQIASGNTYNFNTDSNDKGAHDRFIITRNYAPQITTDVEEPTSDSSLKGRAKKMILEQKFYIYHNGVLYDGMGKRVSE